MFEFPTLIFLTVPMYFSW